MSDRSLQERSTSALWWGAAAFPVLRVDLLGVFLALRRQVRIPRNRPGSISHSEELRQSV
jgi:hypothetical protein